MRKKGEFLRYIKSKVPQWYIVPRAFWPYTEGIEGIPGFHYFLKRYIELQKESKRFDKEDEDYLLLELEDKGITPAWEDQEDYNVHFRNRINFAKKMGFLDKENKITEIGKEFLKGKVDKWKEIFEHQLIKFQLYNPSSPSRYEQFKVFPYVFTLLILSRLNTISFDEFALRISYVINQNELNEVVDWILDYRNLNENEQGEIKANMDLKITYNARMVIILFAFTPALDFVSNNLVIKDNNRFKYLLSKVLPYIEYTKYINEGQWLKYYCDFDKRFWPLYTRRHINKSKIYNEYLKREESEDHKNIKKYIIENSEVIIGKGFKLYEEEYVYASMDRANLVFKGPGGKFTTVEVEVNVGKNDIVGLLQSIKYKYMFSVQENISFDKVDTILVAYNIHSEIKKKCSKYKVRFFEVNKKL